MLKRRVIIGLMFDDGVLTRTKNFKADYRYTQQFLAVDAIDEAICIDITRAGGSEASRDAMRAFADRCYAPVSLGGNVETAADVRRLFQIGADKVVVGKAALKRPEFITELAVKYGSQAVVVACDVERGKVRGLPDGHAEVSPEDWCREAEARGAGEIYLQSVERDGSLSGYDLPVLRRCVEAVGVPVTVGCGCGSWSHMQAAFEAGASGAVTTNVFHWTETTLRGFKDRLAAAGLPIRRAA